VSQEKAVSQWITENRNSSGKQEVVGAPGFEPGASCAQGKSRNVKAVGSSSISYVMLHSFSRYSSMFVPKF
jgi:hypothetical protein